MPTYPEYVYQTLARARNEGQWYCGQSDAAALCFDILALFPECTEASDLVYELFCGEWTIYDNRVALQQNIDEWDDRPWQQRRRLALSFRFMSRWDGKYEAMIQRGGPKDVREILHEGKLELLGAYCLGDEECTDYAWSIFADAIHKAKDPQAALHWIGWQYADLGFFADAAEALGELCSRYNDEKAKRLLAEVIWWRDNAHHIPWIPPAGDGSRYDRIIKCIDPEAPTTQEQIAMFRSENHIERTTKYKPSIASNLANLFAPAIPEPKDNPAPCLVDWSFLDADDGQPGEPADWVKKQMKLMRKEFRDEEMQKVFDEMMYIHRWKRNIPPPPTPPACILACINDETSPLATAADIRLPIHAGPESTVSTKTYVNTLAVNLLAARQITGQEIEASKKAMLTAANEMEAFLSDWQARVHELDSMLGDFETLLVLGRGASMGAVWNGALINKEAAKFSLEGMNAAEFRHGPLELAAPGFCALIFAGSSTTSTLNRNLAADIMEHGGHVIWLDSVTDPPLPTFTIPVVESVRSITEILPMQLLTIALSNRRGIEPGIFRYIEKITTSE